MMNYLGNYCNISNWILQLLFFFTETTNLIFRGSDSTRTNSTDVFWFILCHGQSPGIECYSEDLINQDYPESPIGCFVIQLYGVTFPAEENVTKFKQEHVLNNACHYECA